ncbi:hypothetical protein CERSUDRAFT_92888 [Gelatoporia subvermispora B]|uniref:O-methyltransferase C-terminal domain-containing protein n=1 Tax=Ceriporiopsis subvermispora (strain B) TaxID=914234 RepID=M2QP63_CERS8|nr:hypothetical protein CERSUDRAFT_92888 [Gelatoporia subvermispora B]
MTSVIAGNVPEIWQTAGVEGLHVDDIATRNNMDPAKLSRIVRLLANEHMFKEISPNVFRHNRISATLDTGNSLELIEIHPQAKYNTELGISSFVALMGDESMEASANMSETLLDSRTAYSNEPTQTAFNRAFQRNADLFEWYKQPENEHRRSRFNTAMTDAMVFSERISYNVGGGIGTTVLTISSVHRHLCYVVQDTPDTVDQGVKFWESKQPDALQTGMVQFQKHDFFMPQPVRNASVFILRCIVHDWSDRYAIKRIRQLRDAATPDTQLLLVEYIIRYTCSNSAELENIPGAAQADAPAPLLANYGNGAGLDYQLDLEMMVMRNSQERSLTQFIDLLRAG